ncbi:MAG: type II toxin-antitoxin system MqsA family antitoxin [Bacteroidales bacterium]
MDYRITTKRSLTSHSTAEAIKQLAKEVDTKEATDLARIRKKLKLTQQQAALLTGGGPNAFSRYERGKAKPLQSVTNLFKLLDNHPELLDEIQVGGRV